MGPYNVNSILNPILFICLVHGYFYNLYKGKPFLKDGGVLIALHPLTEEFNKIHHPSYVDFYNKVLTKTLNTTSPYLEHIIFKGGYFYGRRKNILKTIGGKERS